MSFDGNGTFNQATTPVVAGTVISSSNYNTQNTDFVNGLSNVICKDGQTTITANLPMSGYRHTGVGNAAARTDYAAAGQVQDGAFIWCGTAGGTANALTLTPTPAISAYAAGQVFRFKAGASGNSGAATVAVSGLTAQTIQKAGSALASGDIVANQWYQLLYDGTNFQLSAWSGATGLVAANISFAATQRALGRNTSGAGAGEEVTLSQMLDWIGSAAQGDILYRGAASWERLAAGTSGQFLKTNGAGANPAWAAGGGWTLATPVATTSGTAIDFTGIPSTARMIAMMLNGVSLSGTASHRIQTGDSGGIETTGYVGTVGSRTADTNLSAGFDIDFATAATAVTGTLLLTCLDTTNNIWTAFGIFAADSTAQSPRYLSGRKPLSATLDRIRLTSSNGTDTFDAGSVNILYQ